MKALSSATGVVRHTLGAAAEALLLAAIIAALLIALAPVYAPAGFLSGTQGVDAGRGGNGVITVPDGTFGGTTTATVNPGGSDAWARAFCYQEGKLVYGQYVRVNSANQATFQLGPTPSWQGGYASCVAEEIVLKNNGSWRVLASTTFKAASS